MFHDNIDIEYIEMFGRAIPPSILLAVHLFSQMNLIIGEIIYIDYFKKN